MAQIIVKLRSIISDLAFKTKGYLMFLKRFKSNVGDEIAVRLISEPQCFAENMYYDDSQFACIFSDSIEKRIHTPQDIQDFIGYGLR